MTSTSGSSGNLHVPPPLNLSDSSNSESWSTVVTPGIDPEPADSAAPALPSVPTESDQTSPTPATPVRRPSIRLTRSDQPEGYEKKEVRFAGPDGTPLSPSATIVNLDSYTAPDAPPPSEFTDSGRADDDTLPDLPLPPTIKPESQHPEQKPTEDDATLRFPTIPLAPPPVERNIPSAPATTPSQPQPLPSAPRETVQVYPTELDSKSIERCQKHARWAISALDYEDLETARKELRLALDMLEGR